MKTVSVVLFLLAARGIFAQGFSADLPSVNARIVIREKLEPVTPPMEDLSSGIESGPGTSGRTARHTLIDSARHLYFGYDVAVDRLNADSFRVTFSALDASPDALKLPDPAAWSRIPSPGFPLPQVIHVADTMMIDLFENPATGQKIVDYVHLEDTVPCNGEAACLVKLTDKLGQDLAARVAEIASKRSSAQAAALVQSQQSWEQYKQDACGALTNPTQQVNCAMTLTLSRLGDLKKIY